MQFPTANDSLPYAPIQIIDRSPIRTDLRSRWPNDGLAFVDDADRAGTTRSRRIVAGIAGLVAVVALTVAATSALATPAPSAPFSAKEGAPAAPFGVEFRVAPGHGMPASLYLD
jgi:hypothetical protein